MRVKPFSSVFTSTRGYSFECPGCGIMHAVNVAGDGNVWTFNGDTERPTFTPSILIRNAEVCHSFVTDGRIQFLNDCTHALAGQTVELPEVE